MTEVDELRARLAMAREALARCIVEIDVSRHREPPPDGYRPVVLGAVNINAVLEAIDAADPGRWVRQEKLTEALMVLDDLKQERRSPAQERIERALALAQAADGTAPGGWVLMSRLIAILEGREPEPAKTAAGELALIEARARTGFMGPEFADDDTPRGGDDE